LQLHKKFSAYHENDSTSKAAKKKKRLNQADDVWCCGFIALRSFVNKSDATSDCGMGKE
jgi:hypothetical protein